MIKNLRKSLTFLNEDETVVKVERNSRLSDALKKVPGIEIKKINGKSFIYEVDGKEEFYIYEIDGKFMNKSIGERIKIVCE